MGTELGGLFGPSQAEIARQIREEGRAKDLLAASVPRGRSLVVSGAKAGRLLSEGLFGKNDPRLKKAALLEDAKREVMASGAKMGTPEFFSVTKKALLARGLVDEAFKVDAVGTARANEQTKTQLEQLKAMLEMVKLQSQTGATDALTGLRQTQTKLEQKKVDTFEERAAAELDRIAAQISSSFASARLSNARIAKINHEMQSKFPPWFKNLDANTKQMIIASRAMEDPEIMEGIGGLDAHANILASIAASIRDPKTTKGDMWVELAKKVEQSGEASLTPGQLEVWKAMGRAEQGSILQLILGGLAGEDGDGITIRQTQ